MKCVGPHHDIETGAACRASDEEASAGWGGGAGENTRRRCGSHAGKAIVGSTCIAVGIVTIVRMKVIGVAEIHLAVRPNPSHLTPIRSFIVGEGRRIICCNIVVVVGKDVLSAPAKCYWCPVDRQGGGAIGGRGAAG